MVIQEDIEKDSYKDPIDFAIYGSFDPRANVSIYEHILSYVMEGINFYDLRDKGDISIIDRLENGGDVSSMTVYWQEGKEFEKVTKAVRLFYYYTYEGLIPDSFYGGGLEIPFYTRAGFQMNEYRVWGNKDLSSYIEKKKLLNGGLEVLSSKFRDKIDYR